MSKTINIEDLGDLRKNSPFSHLKIQDDIVLYQNADRITCKNCSRNMKHYCYDCYNVIGMDRSEIPFVKLPVTLDM